MFFRSKKVEKLTKIAENAQKRLFHSPRACVYEKIFVTLHSQSPFKSIGVLYSWYIHRVTTAPQPSQVRVNHRLYLGHIRDTYDTPK